MKSFKFLAASLLVALTFTGCEKESLFQTGIDPNMPCVTDVTLANVPYDGKSVTVQWDAAQAVAAGAKSFTVEFVLSSNDTIEVQKPDNYDSSVSATVKVSEDQSETTYQGTVKGQTKGNIYYIKVRANYPKSVYSEWVWLTTASGERARFKVGRGIITEGIEDPYLYKVTPTSTGIIIKWDKIPGATGYEIEYKPSNSSSWTTIALGPDETNAKIKDLPSNTSYDVRAKTYTDAGASDYCETVTVTTRQPGSYKKQMSTADELIAWLEGGVVEVEASEVYEITADIDITGQSFTAMDEPLMGTFNGNGHTIKGAAGPLFFQNEGTIKDLKVINADVAIAGAEVYSFVKNNKGTLSNVAVTTTISGKHDDADALSVGGITLQNSGVIDGCTFDGGITVSAASIANPVIIGGIAMYNEGTIKNSTNKANVTLSVSTTIKAIAIAGIAGYNEGAIEGSTNKGAISASAQYANGKGTIITTDNATPAVAGICAYGYTDKFSLKGCTNDGTISYELTQVDKYTSSLNRNQFGGVVANPYGIVEDCVNNGKVNITLKSSSGSQFTAAEHIVCVGGIGGGDYFAGPASGRTGNQDKTSYINCTNNGDINLNTCVQKSNSTCGGICGWPGAEAARDSKTSGCTNYGEITISGSGKTRTGGIHGGTGNIENCVNYGKVHIESADKTTPIGGLAGFHSQTHYIKGSKSYGTVVSDIECTQGVGGLVGNQGNAASKISNCEVLCKVVNKGADAAQYTGMMVGYWNGTSSSTQYGTASAPVKIGGIISLDNKSTALTSGNYQTYIQGLKNSGGSHTISTVFNGNEYVDPDGPGSDDDDKPAVSIAAPGNVAVSVLYNSVTITWDEVEGAEWYVVEYKAKDAGEWQASDRLTECTYTIENIAHGTDFSFRVKAFASVSSSYSDTVTKTTLEEVNLAAPAASITAQTAKTLTVSWEAVAKATGYAIQYRAADAEEWSAAGTVEAPATSYEVGGLNPTTTYYVRVKALGEGGNEGEYGSSAVGTTEAVSYSYPLSIANGKDFVDWLGMGAEFAKEGDQITIDGDLDLKGLTVASAPTFAATLNGNGKTIKNWTSDKTSLVVANAGTIKDLTIDSSCSATAPAGGNFGLVACTNEGTISGITNKAKITLADTFSSALLMGAVAGQSTGIVSNCTNAGDITITTTQMVNYSTIGGVVGQFSSTDGTAAVENCTNSGAVKLSVTGIIAITYFGGVVGGTVSHKPTTTIANVTKNCPNQGTVKGCKNTGAVTMEWTVSGSGSYCNAGGVAGYLEGDIENCENAGPLTISSPGDPAACSTRPAAGGVAGYVMYSAKSCYNSAKITAVGAYSAGTNGNQGAGGMYQPNFGGVFGGIGWAYNATSTGEIMEDCHNTGEIDFKLNQKTAGGTKGNVGAVAGYCSAEQMTGCYNTGKANLAVAFNAMNVAGVAGLFYGTSAKDCYNAGEITFDGRSAELGANTTNKLSAQIYAAGVIGYSVKGATLENLENRAALTMKDYINEAALSYLGGINGSYSGSLTMKNCKNTGAITSVATASQCVGGLSGAFNGVMTDCTNEGAVSAATGSAASGKETEIGGLIGYANATLTGNKNTGAITTATSGTFAGGLVGGMGSATVQWSGCTVDCTITGDATKGSILGRVRTAPCAIYYSGFTIGSGLAGMDVCGYLNGSTVTEGTMPTE